MALPPEERILLRGHDELLRGLWFWSEVRGHSLHSVHLVLGCATARRGVGVGRLGTVRRVVRGKLDRKIDSWSPYDKSPFGYSCFILCICACQ